MTLLALALLLAAGGAHAGWNYIGTLMGSRWLAEGEASRRIPGAVAIVAGLAALSAG
jgi:hypothetical protein